MRIPATQAWIMHFTHIDNLPAILAAGRLLRMEWPQGPPVHRGSHRDGM
ncbi:hypothetical protein [Micromonospora mirobrigensis]|nr:hypothetical protein [Micromonospora mirobrigensis]